MERYKYLLKLKYSGWVGGWVAGVGFLGSDDSISMDMHNATRYWKFNESTYFHIYSLSHTKGKSKRHSTDSEREGAQEGVLLCKQVFIPFLNIWETKIYWIIFIEFKFLLQWMLCVDSSLADNDNAYSYSLWMCIVFKCILTDFINFVCVFKIVSG